MNKFFALMSSFLNLRPTAAEIRDANRESENTAFKVGNLLMEILLTAEKELNEVLEKAQAIVQSVSSQVESLRSDHQADIRDLMDRYTELKAAILNSLDELDAAVKTNADSISNIDDYIIPQEVMPAIDYNRVEIDRLRDSVGQPTREVADDNGEATVPGIAPLDESGKIAARFLPSCVDYVMVFDGFVTAEAVTEDNTWPIYDGTFQGARLVFCKGTNTFMLQVTDEPGDDRNPGPATTTYYSKWPRRESELICLGEYTDKGYKPLKNKTYYNPQTNKSYRWSGQSMVPTGSDLDLGAEAGTAFPGDRGAALERRIEELTAELARVSGLISKTVSSDESSD